MSGADFTMPSKEEVEQFSSYARLLLIALRQFDYMAPESYRNLARSDATKSLIRTLANKLTDINQTYCK